MLPLPRHGNGVDLSLKELLARAEHQTLVRSPDQGAARAITAGERLSRQRGRGMEFAEVRAYQPGDDIRTIDWRVTARTGAAHTKLFRDERERPVLLCVDLGSRQHLGSQLLLQSVQAGHLAALLGWHVMAHGDRLGGIVCNDGQHKELKPRSRRAGLLPLLEALVELHPQQAPQGEYWSEALERLQHLARPGSLVVIITNPLGLDPASLQKIKRVKRHAEVRLFAITDPLYQQMAQVNQPLPVRLPGQGQPNWLDRRGAQQLAQRWQQAWQQAQQLSRQYALPLSEISAGQPLQNQWQQLWI
ncbi:DUF58 domain-containing protein [Ferrimonas marina]|uniref:DUF58 domain-containing protein n=1 Tax=Ferrimonas marina TaxID=299255 RepID=A0A1M5Y9Y4_9GAMM|nr:DUF58 domain-containing protein [Ferrimonas marina]SHI08901.1 Protein of unknown function DUF58 [Ferrimonas marina]